MNTSYYKSLVSGLLYAALLALFIALATYFISGTFGNATKILLIVGGGLLVGYVVASPETVLGAFQTRGAKYGGNTVAMIVLFVAIVGAANWFVSGHSPNWDITANKLHTLTPQTDQILTGLNQDVKITAFFQTGAPDEQSAKDLLGQYAAKSSHIQYQMVDPDKDPVTARQFGIVSYGTTVFQSGTNRKDVPSPDEQSYTSAILSVTSAERRKVYFVVGNGQPDPNNAEQQGYHDALLALQNNNYVTATLDATAPTVPDDASAVILTAGTQPLTDTQKSAYIDYLVKGGKMLVASTAFPDTDLNDVVKPWGLQFMNGVTIDTTRFLQQGGPQVPAVSSYAAPGNDIVKNLTFTVFPVANGIQLPQPTPQGITRTVIATTSDQSWLQTHKDSIQFRDGEDTRGPINLVVSASGTLANPPSASPAAAASGSPAASPSTILPNPSAVPTLPPASSAAASANPSATPSAAAAQPTQTPTPIPNVSGADVNLKGGTRIVAVADTSWMNDQFLNAVAGNHDLLLNSVNYLVGNTALVNIPSRPATPGQVNLLGTDANLIFFTTVVFVPLAVLVIGAVVWWQRR